MRILLTNDDGIHAPGIIAMHGALTDHANRHGGPLLDHSAGAVSRSPRSVVFPVAPLTVQSATSHGVTFHTPLMVSDERVTEEMRGVAVDGRPADCVKLAVANIWPDRFGEGSRPELLVSGLNSGANCGINVIYSGTVAAALEAAFLGVPSIAVSMMMGKGTARFDIGAFWARKAIDALLRAGLPRPHECLSINVPLTDAPGLTFDSPVPSMRVCPMNAHGLIDRFERRSSPSGEHYYWATGHGLDFQSTDPGSDVDYLKKGEITITPLTFDLTRHDQLSAWAGRLAR